MVRYLALAAALLGGSARAATVSLDFDVKATGFFDSTGTPAPPVDPVIGHFKLAFDNSADIQRSTSIAVSGLNIAYVGTIGFSYSKFYDGISIGIETTPDGYFNNNNEFGFLVDNVSTGPTSLYNAFDYSDAANSYSATQVTITNRAASSPIAAAPEPATWAMLLLGSAVAGVALRRRQRPGRHLTA